MKHLFNIGGAVLLFGGVLLAILRANVDRSTSGCWIAAAIGLGMLAVGALLDRLDAIREELRRKD